MAEWGERIAHEIIQRKSLHVLTEEAEIIPRFSHLLVVSRSRYFTLSLSLPYLTTLTFKRETGKFHLTALLTVDIIGCRFWMKYD